MFDVFVRIFYEGYRSGKIRDSQTGAAAHRATAFFIAKCGGIGSKQNVIGIPPAAKKQVYKTRDVGMVILLLCYGNIGYLVVVIIAHTVMRLFDVFLKSSFSCFAVFCVSFEHRCYDSNIFTKLLFYNYLIVILGKRLYLLCFFMKYYCFFYPIFPGYCLSVVYSWSLVSFSPRGRFWMDSQGKPFQTAIFLVYYVFPHDLARVLVWYWRTFDRVPITVLCLRTNIVFEPTSLLGLV